MGQAQDLKDRIDAERLGFPFLIYRDGADEQQIYKLDPNRPRHTVGRDREADIRLDWDSKISGLHAELLSIAGKWVVVDDGLSRNGTYVNGERVQGRWRLQDGDTLVFGDTTLGFHHTRSEVSAVTVVDGEAFTRASLSEAQLRVLTALCRPLKGSPAYGVPATNKQIADELYLSVDAVKTHMKALFAKFDVGDLPQNRKRLRVVELAFKAGIVADRDL